jgi:AraC-like DNA-binding protein
MKPLAELRILIARHAGKADMTTALPGLMLASVASPTQPVHHLYEPVFAVVAQGAKRAVLGDRIFDYRTGQYLLVSVDLPITGHVAEASAEAPFLAVGLMLKPAAIASLLLEAATGAMPAGEVAGLAVSDLSGELLDPLVRLLRLLDRPRDAAVLAPMAEREILWRLLCGEQGAMLRQIGLADSRLSQVSHAIGWIRKHYAEPLRIDELASLAAMSASSFHRHFRAVTSMSPLQYQKQLRLQEARARLLAESGDVAAIGFGVGYDSPSQFSREYSRLFGVPPGRDSERLRGLPVAAPGVL